MRELSREDWKESNNELEPGSLERGSIESLSDSSEALRAMVNNRIQLDAINIVSRLLKEHGLPTVAIDTLTSKLFGDERILGNGVERALQNEGVSVNSRDANELRAEIREEPHLRVPAQPYLIPQDEYSELPPEPNDYQTSKSESSTQNGVTIFKSHELTVEVFSTDSENKFTISMSVLGAERNCVHFSSLGVGPKGYAMLYDALGEPNKRDLLIANVKNKSDNSLDEVNGSSKTLLNEIANADSVY